MGGADYEYIESVVGWFLVSAASSQEALLGVVVEGGLVHRVIAWSLHHLTFSSMLTIQKPVSDIEQRPYFYTFPWYAML